MSKRERERVAYELGIISIRLDGIADVLETLLASVAIMERANALDVAQRVFDTESTTQKFYIDGREVTESEWTANVSDPLMPANPAQEVWEIKMRGRNND